MLSACCACLVLGVDDRVTCLLMAQSRLERFCVKKPDQRLCLSRLSGLSLKGLVLLCAISRWRVLRCVVRAQIFCVRRPIHHFGVSFSRPGRASLRKRRRSETMGSVVCCSAYAGSAALACRAFMQRGRRGVVSLGRRVHDRSGALVKAVCGG